MGALKRPKLREPWMPPRKVGSPVQRSVSCPPVHGPRHVQALPSIHRPEPTRVPDDVALASSEIAERTAQIMEELARKELNLRASQIEEVLQLELFVSELAARALHVRWQHEKRRVKQRGGD